MKKVRLTANEAKIIYDCAGQMRDDFESYYESIMDEKEYKLAEKALESGMDKLFTISQRKGLKLKL